MPSTSTRSSKPSAIACRSSSSRPRPASSKIASIAASRSPTSQSGSALRATFLTSSRTLFTSGLANNSIRFTVRMGIPSAVGVLQPFDVGDPSIWLTLSANRPVDHGRRLCSESDPPPDCLPYGLDNRRPVAASIHADDGMRRIRSIAAVYSSIGTGGSPRAVMMNTCWSSNRYRSQRLCPSTRRTWALPGEKAVSKSPATGRSPAASARSRIRPDRPPTPPRRPTPARCDETCCLF